MVVKIMGGKNKSFKEKATSESNNDDDETQQQTEKVPQSVFVIAQEIKMVKSLASNDLVKRNRQLKKLRKWMELRSKSSFPFKKDDFERIWKGLYYTMWMSDKPLVQEDLAEQLARLFECFGGDVSQSVEFFGAFLSTMCCQWFGIDQWRIDKFMMLVRRMLRRMLRVLRNAGFKVDYIKQFSEELKETVLAKDIRIGAAGLTMHFLDIFCDELAKVAEGKISPESVGELMKPFVEFYCTQPDSKLTSHCRNRVFYQMLYQSALGREFTEKYNAWKEMGFPTASINDLEKADAEDDESNGVEDDTNNEDAMQNGENNEERVLDPRAGNVDVFIEELPLDGKYIIDALQPYIYKYECNTRRRKSFKKLVQLFETYQKGEFPLGVKRVPRINLRPDEEVIEEQVTNLEDTENDLYGAGRELKKLNKKKRRKLLKSINFDEVDDEKVDDIILQAIPSKVDSKKTGDKKLKRKHQNSLTNNWVEEELSTEDNTKPKKVKNSEKNKTEVKSKAESKTMSVDDEDEDENQEVTGKSSEKENDEEPEKSPWDEPLAEGEVEYFQPSRKQVLKRANSDLRLNPLAMKKKLASEMMAAEESSGASVSSPSNVNLLAKKSKNTPNSTPTNPLAMKKKYGTTPIAASPVPSKSIAPTVFSTPATPLRGKQANSVKNTPKTPTTSSATKRVKIALKLNSAQHPSEYYRQLKSSPDIPYDANKKPSKGLLKPNSMPSPINPFYKKKIGLRLFNDTM